MLLRVCHLFLPILNNCWLQMLNFAKVHSTIFTIKHFQADFPYGFVLIFRTFGWNSL